MTVITVVAIAAVAAFFYAFVWPGIRASIAGNTCKNMCPNGEYESYEAPTETTDGSCNCGDGVTVNIPAESES